MRNSIWEKKIPTLLGIFLIVVGLGLTSYLATQGIIYISKASPSNKPEEVRITNITDSTFTISYRTSDKVIGSINYGKNKALGTIRRDDRDQQNNTLTPFSIHTITLRNLDESTKYFFTITSGNETFDEQVYEVVTASKIEENPSQQEPISGKIISPDGKIPNEGIIYATIDGAQLISTLAKPDGRYILPLNSLRNIDLNSYFNFNENKIKIQAIGEKNLSSNIVIFLKQTRPVPTTTLSLNYDFTEGNESVSTDSAELQNFSSFTGIKPINKSAGSEVKIISPENNQGFSDQQPLFKGTAEPNSTVEVIIHSAEEIKQQITVNSQGNWTFRPEQPLSPGEHTITIVARDTTGIQRTITKTFVVFESGTQVTESATPSATPTIPEGVTSPTPIITIPPTAIPISTPIPTEIPVLPTSIATSSPIPTIASPGSSSAFQVGIIGLSLSLFGGFLFLLTHKKSIL